MVHTSCVSVGYCQFINPHFWVENCVFYRDVKGQHLLYCIKKIVENVKKKKKSKKNFQPSKYLHLHHSPDNPCSNDSCVCSTFCFFWESNIHSLTVVLIQFAILIEEPVRYGFLLFASCWKVINAVVRGVQSMPYISWYTAL